MRGEVHGLVKVLAWHGITPAHAGRRRARPEWRAVVWDHPRACGEKAYNDPHVRGKLGSPPRMRGEVSSTKMRLPSSRITPAHAGRSMWFTSFAALVMDHPRACGEKRCTSPTRWSWSRITPAHAGRRVGILKFVMRAGDHPRACGEKSPRNGSIHTALGSPPRMRGEELAENIKIAATRITPAHAGRSSRWSYLGCNQMDHPRACGEKAALFPFSARPPGSPPRMRGEVLLFAGFRPAIRITPAHAGRRWLVAVQTCAATDHPRACGEKTKKIPYHRLFPLRSAPFSFSFA